MFSCTGRTPAQYWRGFQVFAAKLSIYIHIFIRFIYMCLYVSGRRPDGLDNIKFLKTMDDFAATHVNPVLAWLKLRPVLRKSVTSLDATDANQPVRQLVSPKLGESR